MSLIDVHCPDWMDDARCAEVGAELFFPEKGMASAGARRICRACPVSLKCLEWAHEIEAAEGSMPGIYGGLSAAERARLRRKPRQKRTAA